MVCYIRRKTASLPLIEKIISKLNLSVTSNDFYEYVSNIQLPNYIKMDLIYSMWFDS
jgi:hypothetical protein